MVAIGLMLIFVALVLLDFKKVWRKKGLAVKVVYTSILGFAFLLSELHVFGFHLFGLNQIITGCMKLLGISI